MANCFLVCVLAFCFHTDGNTRGSKHVKEKRNVKIAILKKTETPKIITVIVLKMEAKPAKTKV